MLKHSRRPVPPGVEYQRVLSGKNRQVGRGILALTLAMAGLVGFPIAANILTVHFSSTLGNLAAHFFSLVAVALPIPWSMLVQRWLYGVSGSSLHSVSSKFRWNRFRQALLIAVPIWLCFFTLIIKGGVDGINHDWFTLDFVSILAAVMLYAAAEQYATSGLALRVGASWSKGPVASIALGILVSSLLFVVAEQETDPLVMIYSMIVGVGAAIITWRTGGLETASVLRATYFGLGFASSRVFHYDPSIKMNQEAGSGFPPWAFASVLILAIAGGYWVATRKFGVSLTPAAAPPVPRTFE